MYDVHLNDHDDDDDKIACNMFNCLFFVLVALCVYILFVEFSLSCGSADGAKQKQIGRASLST